MSHPYQYVVLRYVPRVDRGECLNVGVVVHSQSAGVLLCRYDLDEDRIRAVAPDADLESLRRLSKEEFKQSILKGRPEKGMPNFDGSKMVTENWEGLYAYLKGRSDGQIQPGRLTALDKE